MRLLTSVVWLAGVLLIASSSLCRAQYKVIYTFGTNPSDGNLPNGGLVFDKVGNIYGTTQLGGTSSFCNQGCGTVFELSPSPDGTWSESLIYSFCSQSNCADGLDPLAGLVIDSGGNLYGTTQRGGSSSCVCGTVFELSPPKLPGETWTYTVIWNFNATDGAFPAARLNWNSAGNLYGTTYEGGDAGVGTVFELSPVQGGWTEQVLYSFCVAGPPTCSDGYEPMAGVTFDSAGNLYGTTTFGGGTINTGVLFKLSPPQGNGA